MFPVFSENPIVNEPLARTDVVIDVEHSNILADELCSLFQVNVSLY